MNLDTYKSRYYRENPKRAIKTALGDIIRVSRAKAGLSQVQLAKKLGTTQSAIARVEGGHIEASLSFLHRVAEATGNRLKMPRIVPLPEPSNRKEV